MHRLREWFGIKDWQGPPPKQNAQPQNAPPQNPPSEPTTKTDSEKETKVQKVKEEAKVLPTSQKVTLQKVALPPQKETWYDKSETWLKQYIPHKEGTCFGCKLVVMTTVLAWTICAVSVTVTQAKKFNQDYRKIFILMGLSASSLGLSYLHLTMYDQDPMEPLRKLIEKEKKDRESKKKSQ